MVFLRGETVFLFIEMSKGPIILIHEAPMDRPILGLLPGLVLALTNLLKAFEGPFAPRLGLKSRGGFE